MPSAPVNLQLLLPDELVEVVENLTAELHTRSRDFPHLEEQERERRFRRDVPFCSRMLSIYKTVADIQRRDPDAHPLDPAQYLPTVVTRGLRNTERYLVELVGEWNRRGACPTDAQFDSALTALCRIVALRRSCWDLNQAAPRPEDFPGWDLTPPSDIDPNASLTIHEDEPLQQPLSLPPLPSPEELLYEAANIRPIAPHLDPIPSDTPPTPDVRPISGRGFSPETPPETSSQSVSSVESVDLSSSLDLSGSESEIQSFRPLSTTSSPSDFAHSMSPVESVDASPSSELSNFKSEISAPELRSPSSTPPDAATNPVQPSRIHPLPRFPRRSSSRRGALTFPLQVHIPLIRTLRAIPESFLARVRRDGPAVLYLRPVSKNPVIRRFAAFAGRLIWDFAPPYEDPPEEDSVHAPPGLGSSTPNLLSPSRKPMPRR